MEASSYFFLFRVFRGSEKRVYPRNTRNQKNKNTNRLIHRHINVNTAVYFHKSAKERRLIFMPKNETKITAEPGKQELFITREFDAPRELVFKAHTDAEIYKQWLGPRDLKMTIEKFEPVDGGSYRYIHERDGHQYAFYGVNHEVLAPERIIGTFEFLGLPERGHVILGTLRFEELSGNRTRLVSQSVFQSVADRDGMIASGMERGVVDGYERLDDILASTSGQAISAG